MEINGLDCAKCQNPKLRDMMRIFGMFNENKTKKNSDLLLQNTKKTGCEWLVMFLERERAHSL